MRQKLLEAAAYAAYSSQRVGHARWNAEFLTASPIEMSTRPTPSGSFGSLKRLSFTLKESGYFRAAPTSCAGQMQTSP